MQTFDKRQTDSPSSDNVMMHDSSTCMQVDPILSNEDYIRMLDAKEMTLVELEWRWGAEREAMS